ncbi:uncharacterized protein FIBRA_03822 [Fibroporia radiculosa]|uniref:Glucose-methanol-choline oxidoreductase N-terminal domain-containing protein n=1 Tax=Fibroporia radiculosa TaxID=599839 RepID=J4I9U2_9APHY|nr:uncharacterized protein FIBRA_03822 [Fibroporia radiculosa]CCM01756.1 predicted protein [Fibroporia radiculosa]
MLVSLDQVADKFFDYVVCGGGTAGLTLAVRLSEDPNVSVLVLEAGGTHFDDPSILRPASWGSHFSNSTQSWNFQTVSQKSSGDKPFPWFRGKGLGGSSCINFMCWLKPPAAEIDDLERLGNPGWNWTDYQKHLDKTEGFITPSVDVQERNRLCFDTWRIGTNGPLKISYPAPNDLFELNFSVRFIIKTLINAGLPVSRQPLSGDPTGVFLAPNTYDPTTHTRSYVTTAHYLPHKERENLSVLVDTSASRILTDTTGNGNTTAIGVQFEYENETYTVNVRKETIISAGSIQSPHILELSGIGRKEVLERIGVPIKVDLPGVGENVQEHMFAGVCFELRDDIEFDTVDLLRDPEIFAKQLELHATGRGIFTKGVVGFGFAPLQMFSDKAEDIHTKIEEKIAMSKNKFPPGLMEQYKVQLDRLHRGAPGCEFITIPGHLSSPHQPVAGKRYITILAAMNHCFSRGTIHSASADPQKDPEMDPRYFEQEVDMDIFCEVVKFARKLAQTSPLKDMIVREINPGPEVQGDVQICDWIRNNFSTTWHTASSCSMLPRESGGVVDPELKVYGTNNIRVVDLSIVPLHFAAHPQATVYAIAEKAATIIKTNYVASNIGDNIVI